MNDLDFLYILAASAVSSFAAGTHAQTDAVPVKGQISDIVVTAQLQPTEYSTRFGLPI